MNTKVEGSDIPQSSGDQPKTEVTKKKFMMKEGKIYFLSYGDNTQLVLRFQKSDVTQYYYYDCVHNWNGYETFYREGYCIRSGVTELREASKAEKQSLLRYAIENGTI